MGNVLRDLRYGLRMLVRNKGFAAVAVLALAFGIGPNVAIFSIVWATFLAPLPYPHADQLVILWSKAKGERSPTRANDYLQYVAQSRSFQRLDFLAWATPHLTGPDHQQEEITGALQTPGEYTKTLGLGMALGRDFLPSEGISGNDHVMIMTHRLWQERFHGDPNILQTQVRVDDEPYTVVGVLEAGVADRIPGQFVLPSSLVPGAGPGSGEEGDWGRHWGNVMGRLKPGVTIAQAQAEMSLIDRRLAATRRGGVPKEAWTVSVEPLKNDWLDKKLERNLWLLLAAVGFVLLIACANLANLLLARGASRQQELAVRSALGATRAQVFRQLLTESLALAMTGGAIGIGLGWGLMKLIMAILPDLAKQTAEAVVELNLPVLAFAVGVSLVAGVLAGCAPAWQASKLNLSEMLKQHARSVSGGGRMRTQQLLVMAEFALAVTLLAGAGMTLHSFWNLTHVDLGVRTEHVLTGRLVVPKGPPPNPEQVNATARQLLAKLTALPDVQNAALATNVPLQGHDAFPFSIAGRPVTQESRPSADLEIVTPSYFDTFGVQLVRGRFLTDADRAGGVPVVVVSQSFVDKYLQGMDPLDQRLVMGQIAPNDKPAPALERQIVGVFHSVRNGEHLNDETAPEMFVPYWQSPFANVAVAVRTVLDPGLVAKSVRATVAETMPGASLAEIETMQHAVDTQLTGDRFSMVLFGGFALLALGLAALGIYGVMAFAVAQRSHEIGLRMALGAQQRDVMVMILRDGMKLAAYGVGAGLVGVIALGLLMRSTLYGIKGVDMGSFVVVAILLMAVAMVASLVPARRSAKLDPMVALRQQ